MTTINDHEEGPIEVQHQLNSLLGTNLKFHALHAGYIKNHPTLTIYEIAWNIITDYDDWDEATEPEPYSRRLYDLLNSLIN